MREVKRKDLPPQTGSQVTAEIEFRKGVGAFSCAVTHRKVGLGYVTPRRDYTRSGKNLSVSIRPSIPQGERTSPFVLSKISPARWRGKVFDKKPWLRCNHCFLREVSKGGHLCALADLEEGVITPVHRIRPGAVPDQNAIDKMGGVLASGGLNRQVPHCIGDYEKSGPRLVKFRAAFDDTRCR